MLDFFAGQAGEGKFGEERSHRDRALERIVRREDLHVGEFDLVDFFREVARCGAKPHVAQGGIHLERNFGQRADRFTRADLEIDQIKRLQDEGPAVGRLRGPGRGGWRGGERLQSRAGEKPSAVDAQALQFAVDKSADGDPRLGPPRAEERNRRALMVHGDISAAQVEFVLLLRRRRADALQDAVDIDGNIQSWFAKLFQPDMAAENRHFSDFPGKPAAPGAGGKMIERGFVQRERGVDHGERPETPAPPFLAETDSDFLGREKRLFSAAQKQFHIAQAQLAIVQGRPGKLQSQGGIGGAHGEAQKGGRTDP